MTKIYLTLSIEAAKASVDAVKTAHQKHKVLIDAMEAGIDEDTCAKINDELGEAKDRLADVVLAGLTDWEVDDLETRYYKSGSQI